MLFENITGEDIAKHRRSMLRPYEGTEWNGRDRMKGGGGDQAARGGSGRGDGEREVVEHSVLGQFAENGDKGKVAFGDGFKKPILFQEPFMFRMAHERQVRVQDQGKIAFHDLENRT